TTCSACSRRARFSRQPHAAASAAASASAPHTSPVVPAGAPATRATTSTSATPTATATIASGPHRRTAGGLLSPLGPDVRLAYPKTARRTNERYFSTLSTAAATRSSLGIAASSRFL